MDPRKPDDFLSMSSESGHDDSLQDSSLRNIDLLSDVEDFTERFSQQQDMITQIKEMAMAEETARIQKLASTRLKMEKCTSQLAKIRDRARTNKQLKKTTTDTSTQQINPSESLEPKTLEPSLQNENIHIATPTSRNLESETSSIPSISSTTEESSTISIGNKSSKPKVSNREATKILHQQIKERKAMIAERTKNEKQLEEALMKMQKQLEDNQNQSAEIVQVGPSKINLDLRSKIDESVDSNKVIIELRNRIVQLESNVLDLQETCKEKDSVIRSKTEAITLMSADLSLKGKNTLDLLDDTKEQMQKMQENFATMENNMKLEKQSLVAELEAFQNKVKYLEEANTILEGERFKLSIDNSDLEEKINMKDAEINRINNELQATINQVQELLSKQNVAVTEESIDEKGIVEISSMEELTKKIETLEEINTLLKESNLQIQEELASIKETQTQRDAITSPPETVEIPKFTSVAQDNECLFDVVKVLETISQSLNKRVLDVESYLSSRESKILQLKEEKSLSVSKDIINPEIIISDIANIDDDAISLAEKIKLLENLNYSLKKSNIELENRLSTPVNEQPSTTQPKPNKSATRTNKFGPKGKAAAKAKQQSAKTEETKKDEFNNLWIAIKNMGTFIESLRDQIMTKEAHLVEVDDEINKLNHEFLPEIKSVVEEVPETLDSDEPPITERLDDALKQIDSLSKEIADANKNMIKLKATHKTKVKQMQKSIDDFSKVSESNAELVRLQSQVDSLSQKVTELEDDKGNLQLHLVDYDSDRVSDSQLHAKLLDVERLAEERHKAIADLEMQKFELVQELHLAKQKVGSLEDKVADLSFLENEHVTAEMKCAQLEEELDSMKAENKTILMNIDSINCEKKDLNITIENLNKEKSDINSKLEFYIQENMELIDRLDKLSTEKVSSAESIEMVESLTSQEKMEIEQYQKTFSMFTPHEKDIDEMKEEESTTEKEEILSKIELYSGERQEVIEKLEHYQILNNSLNIKLQELLDEKTNLEEQYNAVKDDRDNVVKLSKLNEIEITNFNAKIQELTDENISLLNQIREINERKSSEQKTTENVQTEAEKEPENLPKSGAKVDKKNTKEILRLKGIIKNKDSEINTLNNKLSEIDNKNEHEELLKNNNDLNEKLQQSLKEIALLNEELKQTKVEKSDNDKAENDLHLIINTNVNKILELEESIKSKEDIILRLEKKLISESDTSKNVTSILESSIVRLINVMNDNDTEKYYLEVNLDPHIHFSEKMTALLNDLQSKIDTLSVILSNNKKKIDDIQSEQDANFGRISQLQKECFNKDETLRDMHQQLSQKNSMLDANSQLIFTYEADIKKLSNLSTEHKRELSAYKEDGNNAKKLQSDFSELQLNYNTLKSDYDTLQFNYNALLTDFDLTKNETFVLNDNLSELTKERDNITSQNNLLTSKLTSYEQQLKDIEQQSISHLEKLQEKTTECENIKLALSKLNVLKDQIDAKQIEINTLIEQLEDVRNSYKEFQSAHDAKIQEREAFVESLEINLEKQQDKISRLEENLSRMESFEKKINTLSAKLQEKDLVIAEKLQRENELDQNVSDLTMQNRHSQKQLQQLQSDNVDISQKNSQLGMTLQQFQNEADLLKSENTNLKSYLTNYQSMEREYVTLSEKYNNMESEFKNKSIEYADTLKKKSVDYELLESTLQSQCDNFDAQTKQYKEQCTKLQEEVAQQLNKCRDIELELVNSKLENESLLSEKEHLSKLKFDESKSSDEIIRLQNERDNLISLMKEKEMEIQKYQQHTLQLQMAVGNEVVLNELKENCREKDAEIDRLRTQFNDCLSQLKDSIETEKVLKNSHQQFLQAVTDKDSIISKLQNELSQLKEPSECKMVSVSQYFNTPDSKDFDLQSLQDQIIPADSIEATPPTENTMIRGFFHDPPTPVGKTQIEVNLTSDIPIIEETIIPKKTYDCYDPKINELEETIKLLSDEKNKLVNDLGLSQTKMNKALLKLKEYKLRYDNVNAELKKIKSSANSSDLDSTIQDELYLQIKNLEDGMKEIKASTDKDKSEKDGLLKRIDVLTSANERLITMKEKQDADMQICKSIIDKLNKKLEIAQWDQGFTDDEFVTDAIKDEKSQTFAMSLKEVDILKDKIKILEADNEDLQSILDKQDDDLKLLKNENLDKSKYELFEKENTDLKNELKKKSDENNNLTLELDTVKEKFSHCEEQLTKSSELIDSLKIEMNENKNEISVLKNNLETLHKEYGMLESKYNSELIVKSERDSNLNLVQELRSDLSNITTEKDELLEKYNNLNEKFTEANNENNALQVMVNEKAHEILTVQDKMANTRMQFNIVYDELLTDRRKFETVQSELEQRISELESMIPETPAEIVSQPIAIEEPIVSRELRKESSECQSMQISNNEELSNQCKELKRNLSEQTLILERITAEKSELEKLLESKDDDLQKYYAYENMCNNKFNEFNAIFNARDKEMIDINDQLNLLRQTINGKDLEIGNKNQEIHYLQQKINDNDQLIQQISHMESKLSETDHDKEAELANLRLMLHSERTALEATISELNEKITYLENQLDSKISECKNLNYKVEELNILINEELIQMNEMRSALEAQEMEIVTLKENLTAHTDAYEKLKQSHAKSERHVSFSEDTKPGDESGASTSQPNLMRPNTDPNGSSRADLDLALYMLHQRDMRCEELTAELMRLLEERDTLQLKLSNAIRTTEEMRLRNTSASREISPAVNTPVSNEEDVVDEVGEEATQSVIVSEPHKSSSIEPSLESKLSQLHSVNYSRDVRLKDESETRQRQMELLQRDVQNLPAEAAAQLREAHYTLSRDTQSASTVLFNWLWGRTTPKVMHM